MTNSPIRIFACLMVFIFTKEDILAQPQIYQTGFSNQERQEVIQNISKLEPLFQKDPTKEMAIQLADAFLYIRRYKKAISYYEYALELAPLNEKETENYFNALFEFGDLSLANTVAKDFYINFKKIHLKAKMDSLENLSKAKPIKVENYLAMNSKHNEYGMYQLFADYRILNSDYSPDKKNTVLASKYMNPYAVSLKPENDESTKFYTLLNNDNYLYAITHYNPSEKKVYITQNSSMRFNLNNILNSTTTMKIFISKIDGLFKLGELVEFKYNSPNYSVGHACVSKDGQTLYFVSDMPGGYGGTDIYRCMKLEDGSWGAPINLGKEVNSKGDEMFPYINPKGNTLYFSSTGNSIFGGLDLNKSTRSRANVFGKASNLGAPFNSNKDDFSIVFTDELGEEGYFSSSRIEGLGGVDIYKFSYENRTPIKNQKKNEDYSAKVTTTIKANTQNEPSADQNQQTTSIEDEFISFSNKRKKESTENIPTQGEIETEPKETKSKTQVEPKNSDNIEDTIEFRKK
jgi:tetratricopeptide (TPR) repeat protein